VHDSVSSDKFAAAQGVNNFLSQHSLHLQVVRSVFRSRGAKKQAVKNTACPISGIFVLPRLTNVRRECKHSKERGVQIAGVVVALDASEFSAHPFHVILGF